MIYVKDKIEKSLRDYGDIIDRDRPVSLRHRPMSIEARAAQFAPFAALTGHKDAIDETGRITERRVELDESEKNRLDRILLMIENSSFSEEVKVTYFVPDLRKRGGSYRKISGRIKKADVQNRYIIMESGERINTADIVSIESDTFDGSGFLW